MKQFIYLLIFTFFILGCGAKKEYQLVYEEHIKVFKSNNHFTTHKIKRDHYTLNAREFGVEHREKCFNNSFLIQNCIL